MGQIKNIKLHIVTNIKIYVDCKMSNHLKIVGAGHLGLRVAVLWKQKFPDAEVYLKTRHNDPQRSAKWKSLGFNVLSSEEDNSTSSCPPRVVVPFVVFCAPPTSNPNYAELVEESIKCDYETSAANNSVFLFTASGGVLADASGARVDESSPVSSTSERSATLLRAEEAVLKNGGVVLRFSGLYAQTRGPHNYWLSGKASEFSSRANGLINLIHYDDAANCILKVLLKLPMVEGDKRLFLVSDGVPVSRMNICKAALKCPVYTGKVLPAFTGDKSVDGKMYDTSLVRRTFEWEPSFKSFEDFMENHCDDEMNIDQFW